MTTKTSPVRLRRHLLVALTVLALALGLAGVETSASAGGPTSTSVAAAAASTTTQRVKVEWQGCKKIVKKKRVKIRKGKRKGKFRTKRIVRCAPKVYQRSASVPGIGRLDFICKPQQTQVRLYVPNRQYETQMWMQKYEVKNGKRVVATKTARVYRYAHANDNSGGGTGYYTHEGLNQFGGVENFSSGGYMNGVISQRAGRKANGNTHAPPVTTFKLDWYWNDLDYEGADDQYCKIDAEIQTTYSPRMGVTWHGFDDPSPTRQETTLPVAGLGDVIINCPQNNSEDPMLTFVPRSAQSYAHVWRVQGEGEVAYQEQNEAYPYDDEIGTVLPIPIPQNGTLRMKLHSGGVERWLLLSSWFKRNDPNRRLNVCEISAGLYTP